MLTNLESVFTILLHCQNIQNLTFLDNPVLKDLPENLIQFYETVCWKIGKRLKQLNRKGK